MACGKFKLQRFDLIICLLWQYVLFAVVSDDLFPIFMNYRPEWRAKNSDADWSRNCTTVFPERSSQLIENKTDDDLALEKNLDFKAPVFSAVQEWSLLCDKGAYYATLVTVFQFVGYFFGAIVLGHLGDHYGRRKTMLAILLVNIPIGCTISMAPNWQFLAVIRFCNGFFAVGLFIIASTYTFELVKPEQRILLKAACSWSNGRLIFTLCCHLVPNWRNAGLTLHMLQLPMFFMIYLLPESTVWLKSLNRMEETEKATQMIAKINGDKVKTVIPDDIEELRTLTTQKKFVKNGEILENCKPKKVYTTRDLFSTRKLTKITLTLFWLWFTIDLLSLINDLNSRNLAGNFFLNQYAFCVFIAITKPALVAMDFYFKDLNRCLLHQIPFFCLIVSFAIVTVIDFFSISSVAILIFNLLGTVFIEYGFDALGVISGESFPTQVRSIGGSACAVAASLGGVVAPNFAYLANLWHPAPFAAVAVVGLTNLIVSCAFLEDTKNVKLDEIDFGNYEQAIDENSEESVKEAPQIN